MQPKCSPTPSAQDPPYPLYDLARSTPAGQAAPFSRWAAGLLPQHHCVQVQKNITLGRTGSEEKPATPPPPTPEEELDAQIEELLAAIDASRKAAALAYEFGHGSAYAYGAVQACTKAAIACEEDLR